MVDTNILNTLGAGSGLDVSAMVDALVNAERAPKQSQIDAKITGSETKISGLGILSSALTTLSDAYSNLNDLSEFDERVTVASSNPALGVKATSSPVPGNYSVTVDQLASSQISRLIIGYDDSDLPIGFDTADQVLNDGNDFSVSVDVNGEEFVLDLSDSSATPQGIVDAINAEETPVTARLVDTGVASGRFQIVLTGSEGAANAFTVSTSVATVENIRVANDAIVDVDGVKLSRASNTIEDAIPGVELELFVTSSTPTSVRVSRDIESSKTAIQDMVNAYNAFVGVLDALGDRENADDDGTGSLAGSSLLRSIKSQLRNIMISPSSSPSNGIVVLSDLGVEFELSGEMSIDDVKLGRALSDSFADVAHFFSAGTNSQSMTGDVVRGLAGDVVKFINDQTSTRGVIKSQEDTLKSNLSRYDKQLEELDLRMEQIRSRYVSQFTAMEQAVDQFNSLRESLTTQFENMPFTNKNK